MQSNIAIDVLNLVKVAPISPEVMPGHAQHVKDNAARRRIEAGAQRTLQAVRDGAPVEQLMELSQAQVDAAVREQRSEAERLGESLDSMLDDVRAIQEGHHKLGIPTGFGELDEITNGLTGGQMVIVAARPGVGKSTLAVDFMRHMSIEKNIPTLMFSLEMSRREVQERVLSAEAEVLVTSLKNGSLSDRDWESIADHVERVQEAPIWIDDSPELTMMNITAKSKIYVQKMGVKMIVVDYLQLLKSGTKAESRQQEVSDFSRQLKLLAKALDVPVVAIAQLNRDVEKRGDDALPKASDLRESGSLEQDADIILLINRPEAHNPDHARAGEADIIVAKNRGGRTGTIQVASRLQYSKFDNLIFGVS